MQKNGAGAAHTAYEVQLICTLHMRCSVRSQIAEESADSDLLYSGPITYCTDLDLYIQVLFRSYSVGPVLFDPKATIDVALLRIYVSDQLHDHTL